MRTVSLKLPDQLDQKITAIARRKRSNRSVVIREALEAFAAGRSKKLSFTAAAGKSVGAFEGPEDLSTAGRHMTGYGK